MRRLWRRVSGAAAHGDGSDRAIYVAVSTPTKGTLKCTGTWQLSHRESQADCRSTLTA